MKITKCEPMYSGGGVYLFCGSLSDGSFFIADNTFYDVTLVTANPIQAGDNAFTVEWQEEHLIDCLPEDVALVFFGYMLDWITWYKPDGNYQMLDIEFMQDKVKDRFYSLYHYTERR